MPLWKDAPAPLFEARLGAGPKFQLGAVAGRYVVLCFAGSAGDADSRALLDRLKARGDLFDDVHATCFAISVDPQDEAEGRIADSPRGFRAVWDFDRKVSTLYEVAVRAGEDGRTLYRRASFVLDPMLRLMAMVPFTEPRAHADQLLALVSRLPRWSERDMPFAPVLVVPRVLDPGFCRELIELYERHGGRDSGFMKTDAETGMTYGGFDHGYKSRRDYVIEDEAIRARIRERMAICLLPEVRKAFDFRATRVERYWICRYDAEEGGRFDPHRDNLAKATAHRRFAVTLNLNAEDYEGGDLRFPEFGPRTYRAPTGGAVVFSCSLLHQVTPMRRGRRYCVVPFLYDEAGARLRAENLKYLAPAAPAA